MPSSAHRFYLIVEFCLLFVVMPAVFRAGWLPLYVLRTLWIAAAVCALILWLDPQFDRRNLWRAGVLPRELPRILKLFLPLAALLALVVLFIRPDYLFSFVRARPGLWAIVMVLYPIFSVYPQGLVYRVFLFHRYRSLLPSAGARIAASGIAFGYMHIVFQNWIAVVLTLVGGLLFAYTYHRSSSAFVATVEHSLYGCFIITLGLGRFVYSGGISS